MEEIRIAHSKEYAAIDSTPSASLCGA